MNRDETAIIECTKCNERKLICFDRWKYGETFVCHNCSNETFRLVSSPIISDFLSMSHFVEWFEKNFDIEYGKGKGHSYFVKTKVSTILKEYHNLVDEFKSNKMVI
jgi:hypothetical protein